MRQGGAETSRDCERPSFTRQLLGHPSSCVVWGISHAVCAGCVACTVRRPLRVSHVRRYGTLDCSRRARARALLFTRGAVHFATSDQRAHRHAADPNLL